LGESILIAWQIHNNYYISIRVTINSTLKTADVPLPKKYRSIKPNTEQSKKEYKTLKKEDEEFTKKEINSVDVVTANMTENGSIIFSFLVYFYCMINIY